MYVRFAFLATFFQCFGWSSYLDPGLQKCVEHWPFGLMFKALGHHCMYFWGPGNSYELSFASSCNHHNYTHLIPQEDIISLHPKPNIGSSRGLEPRQREPTQIDEQGLLLGPSRPKRAPKRPFQRLRLAICYLHRPKLRIW